jgi:spore germination protein GerM
MRFKEFLENVIDKEDEFKRKRSKNFQKKLSNLAADIPNAFKKQEEVEKEVQEKINAIKQRGATSSYEFKHPALMADYVKGTNPVSTIYFAHVDKDDKLQAHAEKIVARDKNKIIHALKIDLAAIKALKPLCDEAPAPQYPLRMIDYAETEFKRMLDYFESIKK